MNKRPQILYDLTNLLELSSPLKTRNIKFSIQQLDHILTQRQQYEGPPDVIIGDRPKNIPSWPEYKSNFRRDMSEYIQVNTNIEIPVDGNISSKFYDDFANSLGI